MESTESKTPSKENNAQKSGFRTSDPDPPTQIQRDSVITREDLPNFSFRLGLTIGTLVILLLVAALYYGILTP